jgi:two-component system phosphate regulon sensor histidine kinase PhoR
VLLVIAVSLGLTGLTVWAVAQQGQVLQARELTDLKNAAATVAAKCQAALLTDAERTFDQAGRAWSVGGPDELDRWTASERRWLLACVAWRRTASASHPVTWTVYPRTPLEQPLPDSPGVAGGPTQPSGEPAFSPAESQPPEGGRDLLTLLRDFQHVATSPDPLTRAGAMLAMATCEQQLGHPLAAARIFADAAHLLRTTPHLARFAFRAELARVDSLLAAGDHDRAREAFGAFLEGLLDDHPGRLAPAEVARLERQAESLAIAPSSRFAAALAELRTRADHRQVAIDTVRSLLPIEAPDLGPQADPIRWLNGTTRDGQLIVVALKPIAEEVRLALVAPAADLLRRYWIAPTEGATWQVRLPTQPSDRRPLMVLGPEFAGAVVEPSAAAVARLGAAARRQLGVVLATASGTAGAWALVIWMMTRVVARQRELARLQGRFVADVSHELKTPLALIRLLSETLADQRVRNPERVQTYHQTITHEAERLTVLLDNILDLGRIESGRKKYELAACDVAQVAREAWTLFEPQFAEQGFDARLEIAPNLPAIRADAQALHQVLVNLLQNAYRYAGDGKFVRLSVAREGYVIVITVEDHGIGMSRGQLKRLGESFFRAEDTRVRKTRGTGLGLAIVNHIVTAHRGKVEVQSRPGQGSTFTVWIPFQPEDG